MTITIRQGHQAVHTLPFPLVASIRVRSGLIRRLLVGGTISMTRGWYPKAPIRLWEQVGHTRVH